MVITPKMKRSGFCYFLIVFVFCFFKVVCTQQSCPPPDVPVEGAYIPKQDKFLPGDRVAYTCKVGFTLLGKEVRTCKSNGGWSDRMPFCDRPAKLKNPRVTNSYSSSISKIVDGDSKTCFLWEKSIGHAMLLYMDEQVVIHVIRLFLESGSTKIQVFTGVDNNLKLCADYDRILDRSQWVLIHCRGFDVLADTIKILSTVDRARNISICEIQVYVKDEYGCELPPEIRISNGYFEVSRNKATLVCDEGYRSENNRLVCEGNSWKGLGPKCEELLCDPVVFNKSLAPGTEWEFLDSVRKLSAGTRRQLKCSQGYRKVGHPEIIICQRNATWTYTNATCIAEEKPKTKTSTIVICAIGATVTVLILALLGTTIYMIKKQRNKEVVVVFKPSADGSISASTEAEYATARYYETVQHRAPVAPVPPTSPRPGMLPLVLNQRYILPEDAEGTLKKQQQMPADIAFGTLKQSALYGN